jgi:hypothetical protein
MTKWECLIVVECRKDKQSCALWQCLYRTTFPYAIPIAATNERAEDLSTYLMVGASRMGPIARNVKLKVAVSARNDRAHYSCDPHRQATAHYGLSATGDA